MNYRGLIREKVTFRWHLKAYDPVARNEADVPTALRGYECISKHAERCDV